MRPISAITRSQSELGGDVERVVGAVAAGEIAGDRNARPRRSTASATALPIGAGGAGDQNDLVLEPVHAASAALVIVLVVMVVIMAMVMVVIVIVIVAMIVAVVMA